MSLESIPKFTPPAAKLWSAISPESKKLLLANVWCVSCRHSVTIKNFTGVDSPYEAPEEPDLVIKAAEATPEVHAQAIVAYLRAHGYLG